MEINKLTKIPNWSEKPGHAQCSVQSRSENNLILNVLDQVYPIYTTNFEIENLLQIHVLKLIITFLLLIYCKNLC